MAAGRCAAATGKKSHLNDRACRVVAAAAAEFGLGVALYTSRGHGQSTGWEAAALAGEFRPFSWEWLAEDMLAVAGHHGAVVPGPGLFPGTFVPVFCL